MFEKKVATAVDILVNVDRYEHIKITKYCEAKIEYETEEERIQKEDQLTLECISDLIRGQDIISKTIGGKVVAPCEAIKGKIAKKLPAWMSEGPEPNIANAALENHNESVARNDAQTEKAKEQIVEGSVEMESLLEEPQVEIKESQEPAEDVVVTEDKPPQQPKSNDSLSDDDLFGNDDDLFA